MALQQSYGVADTLGHRGYKFCLNGDVMKFWKAGVNGHLPDKNGNPEESHGGNPAFILSCDNVSKIEELAKTEEDILRLVDSAVKYGSVGDLTEVKLREVEQRSQAHVQKLEQRLAEMQMQLDMRDGDKNLASIEQPTKLIDAEEPAAPMPQQAKKHWKTLAKEAREKATE
jgi:hypothetical protein